jgi:D-tyrosyl-tRNA(Tyr) deacylase
VMLRGKRNRVRISRKVRQAGEMKALVQRVSRARVIVGSEVVSSIAKGLLVFLGVEKNDDPEAAEYIARKIRALRIFEDPGRKMNLSIGDVSGEILVVSQFTLAADCRKGNRPSFETAEGPARANELYEEVVGKLRDAGLPVHTGRFAANMQVDLVNDGPVTILLDSQK